MMPDRALAAPRPKVKALSVSRSAGLPVRMIAASWMTARPTGTVTMVSPSQKIAARTVRSVSSWSTASTVRAVGWVL